jgi:hypothetical protein
LTAADRSAHRWHNIHRNEADITMTQDQQFKIEVEDDKGLWHDVRGSDGAPLVFNSEASARAKLAELYPVKVQMANYGDSKQTRVIRILRDEDDWPAKGAK